MYWIRVTLWCVALACFYVLFFLKPDNVPLVFLLFVLGVFSRAAVRHTRTSGVGETGMRRGSHPSTSCG